MKKTSLLMALLLAACSGGNESTTVDLQVVTAPLDTATVTTDLGFQITLSEARLTVADVLFTTGENEQSLASRVWEWIVPSAHAHPGHFGGGEVAGELLGNFTLDWQDTAQPLGTATLITGPFTGVDFLLRRSEDGELGDPAFDGHSFYAAGTAEKDGQSYPFTALVRFADGTAVIGAYFVAEIDDSSAGTLSLALSLQDSFEGDTLFDGVDFLALDGDEPTIDIRPGSPEHNRLDRVLQSHDHYQIALD
ncbi:MAG: hypothetical protein KJO07_17005 [Deltaproteobacteria bacterium]|nr:hypothetical protein [Deltaproteobacteria bacterium]